MKGEHLNWESLRSLKTDSREYLIRNKEMQLE